MTGYSEQHPVCIERDDGGSDDYRHRLCILGVSCTVLGDVQANALHAAGLPWSTDEPLPNGVFRAPDGRLLLPPQVDLPEGYEAQNSIHDGWIKVPVKRSPLWREVRRVPRPKTERVPWWEAVERQERVTHKRSGPFRADQAWRLNDGTLVVGRTIGDNGVRLFQPVDEDGKVEVLALDGAA